MSFLESSGYGTTAASILPNMTESLLKSSSGPSAVGKWPSQWLHMETGGSISTESRSRKETSGLQLQKWLSLPVVENTSSKCQSENELKTTMLAWFTCWSRTTANASVHLISGGIHTSVPVSALLHAPAQVINIGVNLAVLVNANLLHYLEDQVLGY